jgi:streptomycin 6-kinase
VSISLVIVLYNASMPLHLPERFSTIITSTYGPEGSAWLERLPETLEQCCNLWDLETIPSAFDLSYNYVTAVQRKDGTEAVLKIGYSGEKELHTEMDALRAFNGVRMVQLLESDHELGAMLLERISPGRTLKEVQKEDDEEATRIAAELIRDVPVDVPSDHSFPGIGDWVQVLERIRERRSRGSISAEILDKAQYLFEELDASKGEEKLLHGDLHHDNILFDDERGWIAIDPKGLIGDPAFHGSRFIQNFWGETPTSDLVQKRISLIASALNVPEKRVAQWAYVDCIISNCWTLEEDHEAEIDVSCARILEDNIER